MASRTRNTSVVLFAALAAFGVYACIEPPPKIPAIPASGLAVRVHVFGASASEARQTFQAVKQKNPTFSVVNTGGDGEILVGLENDSPKCVAPTALCSFRVSYRIKDRKGDVVAAQSTTIQASSDRCSDLCARALNNVATKIVETAAGLLAPGAAASDADAAAEGVVESLADDAGAVAKKKPGSKAAEAAKPEPVICSVGPGPHLPTDQAERRAAQVEALKRLGVLDQNEYDCLRKAYLDRL